MIPMKMPTAKITLCGAALLIASVTFADSSGVLGRLGQARVATTIFRGMSSGSRAYCRVSPYEYLVVRPSKKSNWLMVYMQNRAFGYIPSDAVAQLPYNVTKGQTQRPQNPASRGGLRGVGDSSRAFAANYALNFIGTPYVWGGEDARRGIDCSGFVQKMMGKIGMSLPRTAEEQARVGQQITRLEDLQAGDRLYFWEKKRNKIGHTGIYLGNGYFVHSSMGHQGVNTDFLTERWRNILVDARR